MKESFTLERCLPFEVFRLISATNWMHFFNESINISKVMELSINYIFLKTSSKKDLRVLGNNNRTIFDDKYMYVNHSLILSK